MIYIRCHTNAVLLDPKEHISVTLQWHFKIPFVKCQPFCLGVLLAGVSERTKSGRKPPDDDIKLIQFNDIRGSTAV